MVGVVCSHCGSDYESAILRVWKDAEHFNQGFMLRCKECQWSFNLDKDGEYARAYDLLDKGFHLV